jgi:hypothetical protein
MAYIDQGEKERDDEEARGASGVECRSQVEVEDGSVSDW